MADRRFLITGGVGYFGARLAERLAVLGDVVVTSRSLTPERERWLATNPRVTHAFAPPETGEFDGYFNLATAGAGEAAADPQAAHAAAQANVETCLSFLRQGRAKKVIHASTFHVFGAQPREIYHEGAEPTPTHPYGEAHALGEKLFRENGEGLPVFVVRPTNIVGAPAHAGIGPQWRLIFLDLCKQAVETGTIKLLTDGRAWRDFVTMPDAIAAMLLLLEATPDSPAPLHLAYGQSMRLDELAERIRNIAKFELGREIALERGDRADAFRDPFTVETHRLNALGWKPSTDALDEEIRRTLALVSTR